MQPSKERPTLTGNRAGRHRALQCDAAKSSVRGGQLGMVRGREAGTAQRCKVIALRRPIPLCRNSRSHPTAFRYPQPYSPLVASSTALNIQDTAGIIGREGIACSDCSIFEPEINDRGTFTGLLASRPILRSEPPCHEAYAG
ncbi:uncharacterized protein ARMOST_02663 [Armillaria ostoyae]|uniref:Uncharacterized protein n=1 Tax=Armillaria ostoyae TaxID=47428 RepID=A0A284QSA6_ARMOS|nr:uncharacterized protein ARMOST_02663 [Armillaria ostoyae]